MWQYRNEAESSKCLVLKLIVIYMGGENELGVSEVHEELRVEDSLQKTERSAREEHGECEEECEEGLMG